MTRFVPSFVVALGLIACGGAFEGGDDDSGGQAGTAGVGGSSGGSAGKGSGGGSAGSSSGSCEWGDQTYENGESWPSDCNTCTCNHGEVACTTIACGGDTCLYEGITYQVGDSFPAVDGCNTCSCESGGLIACTELGCVATCEDVAAASADFVEQAKVCDPAATNPCTELVSGQLDCGCPTYVNPENAAAIAELAATHDQYAELMCGPSPCDCASPSSAYCSANGQCVDSYDGGAPACRVNGQDYPSGSSGFPGLFGCNTCVCNNGSLICTVDDPCPSACPPDSVPGSQCAQCGPTDACEVIELTCLKVCQETCDVGLCVDGKCQNVCG